MRPYLSQTSKDFGGKAHGEGKNILSQRKEKCWFGQIFYIMDQLLTMEKIKELLCQLIHKL